MKKPNKKKNLLAEFKNIDKKYKLYYGGIAIIFIILVFNQFQLSSLNSLTGGGYIKSYNLPAGASVQQIAAVVLPSEEDQLRPITINGEQLELNLDKKGILLQLDPFPPNGGRSGQIPSDLNSAEGKIFSNLLYGTKENNYKDAVGGCLFCDAPGGAGGCFKKRAIRGLTYTLVKQGWTEEQIKDELKVWMFYYFPGLAVKWAAYYNQEGLDISDIPIDVQTFSRSGKVRVESALQGQDINSVVPDQVGGCF